MHPRTTNFIGIMPQLWASCHRYRPIIFCQSYSSLCKKVCPFSCMPLTRRYHFYTPWFFFLKLSKALTLTGFLLTGWQGMRRVRYQTYGRKMTSTGSKCWQVIRRKCWKNPDRQRSPHSRLTRSLPESEYLTFNYITVL